MLKALFLIVVYPIYALIETMFMTLSEVFNVMLIIIVISLVVNLLCLPLYLNADRLRLKEEEIQKKLQKRIKSIKKNFKGDERYMLLQTYYRQNNYHPVMSLRLSFSLLLQIPFFIAAYLFFSHLPVFSTTSIGIVKNLSEPDKLLKIGNMTVNLFPIFMTFINIFSGYIYAKYISNNKKENIQLLIMSLIFLVLLYNSPSGLVLYWIYNNLFSLLKNIVMTSKNPKRLFCDFLFMSFLFIYYFARRSFLNPDIFLIILLLLYIFIKRFEINKFLSYFKDKILNYSPKPVFILSVIAAALLFGLMIPTGVISSAPSEFMVYDKIKTPFYFIIFPLLQSIGLFGFWGMVFYTLSSDNVKKYLTLSSLGFLFISIFNMFYIKLPHKALDFTLTFQEKVELAHNGIFSKETLLYLFCVGLILFIILLLLKKEQNVKRCLSILLITIFSFSSVNIYKIYKGYLEYKSVKSNEHYEKVLNFSKDKKNVLVIFLDGILGSYLPVIMDLEPQLKEAYKGFTYYPNTVSFSGHTISAYPALMGGYDYMPIKFNNPKIKYKDKYNESQFVLPEIFKNQGYQTVIADPLHTNITELGDCSVLSNRGYKCVQIMGAFKKRLLVEKNIKFEGDSLKNAQRNFLYFSFLKTSPKIIRHFLYDDGRYLNVNKNRKAFKKEALDGASELYYLPELTNFSSDKPTFMVLNNLLSHAPCFISYPDFNFDTKLKEKYKKAIAESDEYSPSFLNVDIVALQLVADYLKYLKENNVFDNTRIIIVADHGRPVRLLKYDMFKNNFLMKSKFKNDNILKYNPLLMVKDFNSNEPLKTKNDFMTNADLASIALKDIVKNPINPFTNNKISSDEKSKGLYIISNNKWEFEFYKDVSIPFEKGDTLHFIQKDYFDFKNWQTFINYEKVLNK